MEEVQKQITTGKIVPVEISRVAESDEIKAKRELYMLEKRESLKQLTSIAAGEKLTKRQDVPDGISLSKASKEIGVKASVLEEYLDAYEDLLSDCGLVIKTSKKLYITDRGIEFFKHVKSLSMDKKMSHDEILAFVKNGRIEAKEKPILKSADVESIKNAIGESKAFSDIRASFEGEACELRNGLEELEKASGRLGGFSAELEKSNEELSHLKDAFAEKDTKLSELVKALEDQNAELKAQNGELKVHNEAMSEKLAQLTEQMTQLSEIVKAIANVHEKQYTQYITQTMNEAQKKRGGLLGAFGFKKK